MDAFSLPSDTFVNKCCFVFLLCCASFTFDALDPPLPLSREPNCPCNLSGCGVSFVVDNFTVLFFPGLVNQSWAFSVRASNSLRLLWFWWECCFNSPTQSSCSVAWMCAKLQSVSAFLHELAALVSDLRTEIAWSFEEAQRGVRETLPRVSLFFREVIKRALS